MKNQTRVLLLLAGTVLAVILFEAKTRAATYYVATNGTEAAVGTNWVTALNNIQTAVDLTSIGDTVIVGDGIYDTGGAFVSSLSTTMFNRVAITNAITVESENGPEVTVIKGTTNVPDIARCVYLGENATLVGFTLTQGGTLSSGDSIERDGGGVYCAPGAVLSDCILSGNTASQNGGGAWGGTLVNCILSNNVTASLGGGAYQSTLINCVLMSNSTPYRGGGAYLSTMTNSTLLGNTAPTGGGAYQGTLDNCILLENVANNNGGGTYQSTLRNCVLKGNVAGYGGGSYQGTLSNCELSGNSASYGGGMYKSVLVNCTLFGNLALQSGGGVYQGTVLNSIVYFNHAQSSGSNWYSTAVFYNSCTTPEPASFLDSITNDPQFVAAASSNMHLSVASPCIDMGNNAYITGTTDIEGHLRFVNVIVDMGAYEHQGAQADSDGDGSLDTEELIAGTNLADSNSFWCVTDIQYPWSLLFESVTGRIYAADYNDTLFMNPHVWVEFTNNIAGTGNILEITYPITATIRNYRVRVTLAP